jgi:energy-coupling factor transport system ATP-binding protein
MTTPVARLSGVTYSYPGADAPALREVDLEIGPGLTLVAGGSGGGKSTLLRVFDGLVPQFHGGRISGSSTIDGLDTFRTPIPRLATRAGLVFQDVETQSVYGSVEREVAFGLENLGTPRAEMHDRVDEVLASLGIEALRHRLLTTLSGGERQRVQLAAVLALRPLLVALDEPTSQLDREGSAAVLAACLDAVSGGRAVVVAEHRLETLLPRADRLLTVDGGRVAEGDLRAAAAQAAAAASATAGRPRFSPSGDPCWELSGVAAGPSSRAIVEGVVLAGFAGEVVALVGPNGSGKTTLLRTLAGLIPALAGTVRRPDGRTAYLPQNPGALLHLPTVRAEVEMTIRRAEESDGPRKPVTTANGTTPSAAAAPSATDGGPTPPESPDEMLAAFGLLARADRYTRDLSSGERQRAALAATLAGSPTLALLDEPTRGMDPAARAALIAAVRRLAGRGAAVVVATHDESLVAELADRVVRVRDGLAAQVPAEEAFG